MKIQHLIPILFLAAFCTGCADMKIQKSNRIFEERKVSSVPAKVSNVMFTFQESNVWLASEHGDRYYVWMPQGIYHLVSEDNDYIYYEAPGGIKLGNKMLSTTTNTTPQVGGIFFNRHAGARYPSGAFVDFSDGEYLLVFCFDVLPMGWQGGGYHEYLEWITNNLGSPQMSGNR